jgi:hypothetical protein
LTNKVVSVRTGLMGRRPGYGGTVDDGVDPGVVTVVGVDGAAVVGGAELVVGADGTGVVGVMDAGVDARADDVTVRNAATMMVMHAIGMIATSAMRVRMAPPFVGRA